MTNSADHRVESAALQAALEPLLERHPDVRQPLSRLRRRLSAYSSSCTIENLEAVLRNGRRLSLVFKDLSPSALLDGARRVRPAFAYAPHREIDTYERILRPERHGTAACYGSVRCPDEGRYWLFLGRVSGRLLWQVGRIEAWEAAARWLARFHRSFAARNGLAGDPRFVHGARYDEAWFRVWPARAEEFLRRRRTSAASRRRFQRLLARHDRLVARLVALPRTFVHGEFYPSNVIVRRLDEDRCICPVDWELAGIGPGLMDLAALTAGEWTPGDRRKMIAAYRDAFEPVRGWPPSLAELAEAVDWCRLQACLQWIGWADDWSPPGPHAQDWLGEALELAGNLGL